MSELSDELGAVLREKRSLPGGWASSAASAAVMKANRRRDTKPEIQMRRLLHGAGLR